jgi:hypothetical protein
MKSRATKSKTRKRSTAGERPPLLRISEEMKEWSALLAAEVERWPGVNSRPMFGMRAFYRKRRIFAAVPKTRALNSPTSVIFKLHGQPPTKAINKTWDRQRQFHDMEDSRLRELEMNKTGWLSFELNSTEDLRDALYWFEQAYNKVNPEAQGKTKSN